MCPGWPNRCQEQDIFSLLQSVFSPTPQKRLVPVGKGMVVLPVGEDALHIHASHGKLLVVGTKNFHVFCHSGKFEGPLVYPTTEKISFVYQQGLTIRTDRTLLSSFMVLVPIHTTGDFSPPENLRTRKWK